MATATATHTEALAARVAKAKAAEAAPEDTTDELVVIPNVESTEVAVVDLPDRSEDMDESDIVYPRIKLGQPLSKQVEAELTKSGEYFLTLEDRNLGADLDIVVLKYKRHMSYFVSGQGLLCRSNDLNYGVGIPGDDNRAQGITCMETQGRQQCPLAQWPKERGQGGPKCRLAYDYIVLARAHGSEEDWATAIITLTGTSLPTGKQINATHKQKRQSGAWYLDTFRLGSKKVQGPKGTYSVATVQWLGNTDADTVAYASGGVLDDDAVSRSLNTDEQE